MLLRNRLFIDTETDGVRKNRRVWDVGMVRYDAEGNRQVWSMMVEDFDLSEAEPSSLTFARFRDRHPKAGGKPEKGTELLPESEIARIVFQVAFASVTAGIVVDFDTEALDNMLRRNGFCWTGWHHLLCVENRALGALDAHAVHIPEVAEAHAELITKATEDRWKTEEIAAAFGIPELPTQQRHTGVGDAILAEMIYLASVVDKVIPRPGVQWQPPSEIQKYLSDGELVGQVKTTLRAA